MISEHGIGNFMRFVGMLRLKRSGRCAVNASLFILGATMVSGCAVGPDFTAPPAPDIDRYTKERPSSAHGGPDAPHVEGQRFVTGADIPAQWWTAANR